MSTVFKIACANIPIKNSASYWKLEEEGTKVRAFTFLKKLYVWCLVGISVLRMILFILD